MTKFRTGDRFIYCEATMTDMYVLANDNGDFLGAFNKKEDANLAANAPALLDALDNLEAEASAEIDSNSSLNLAILAAREAIKNARGE